MVGRSWHLLYRKIFCRRGHGVHSPFVYHFITRVIEEKAHYYAYDDIDILRKKLLYNKEEIIIGSGKQSIDILTRKYDLRAKDGALLFRLANFFKPENILLIAPSDLFSTLYLSWYSEEVKSTVIQNDPGLYALCDKVYSSVLGREVVVKEGKDSSLLSEESHPADLIYLDDIRSVGEPDEVANRILLRKVEHTVLVVKGIYRQDAKKEFWKKISGHEDARVVVDLYDYGIILFNKKLHKRVYKVIY